VIYRIIKSLFFCFQFLRKDRVPRSLVELLLIRKYPMGLAMNASREKVGAGPRKSGPRRSARLRGKTSLLARAARLRTEKLARPHQMANGPRMYAHGTRTGSMTSSKKKKNTQAPCPASMQPEARSRRRTRIPRLPPHLISVSGRGTR